MIFQTIATDKNNSQVDAAIADRSSDFFCPSCKGLMILRRGKKNIAHFAHKNLTPNCKPETVLHILGKDEVKDLLDLHIKNREPLNVNFNCSNCGSNHTKDLLDDIRTVQLEKTLDFARPDVSLLNPKNETLTVVEVVVTHEPEPEVLKLFERLNVFYIRVKLKDYSDLHNIKTAITNLGWRTKDGYSSKGFCTIKDNPELFCSKHGWAKDRRRLFIIDYPCNQCHKLTKIAALNLDSENPFNRELPDRFSKEEVVAARKEGVLLGQHKFSHNGDYYLVNKCSHCGLLPYSDGRLNTQYEYGHRYEDHPKDATIIETGFSCGECEWENENNYTE